ncbi:MAG: hypothetical protein KIS67_02145 [Verrucomicrobiae bacterium]|nr:hypothetical protein [Verrucomicrobiae bacterium]
MPFEWKPTIKRRRGEFLLLLAAMVAAWWWLDHLDDGAKGLRVEVARHAVVGEPLPVHIHLAGLTEATYLCADLHWTNKRDASNGYLATGGTKPVGREGGSFDFEIIVQATNELRFVNVIIYLSPTGAWPDHTFAAATALIPVVSSHPADTPTMTRVPIHLLKDRGRENVRPTVIPRLMTALLLLASAMIAWATCRSISRDPTSSHQRLRRWQYLAAGLTLAGVWELLALENWVGMHLRALARAGDVYHARSIFQRAVISVTLAATTAFLCFGWRKQRSDQVLLVFFGLYLVIAAINLLSFHSFDAYAGISWLGVTLVESLKFVCAAVTLGATWQARR